MDAFDAFAPPRATSASRSGSTDVARPLGPRPPHGRPPERPSRGRVAAVVSLGAGLAALAVAAVGALAVLRLGPAVASALLGAVSLSSGGVALVRSRGRAVETVLLSAAGGACTVVAAGVTTVTLLFPFGLPPLDGPTLPPAEAFPSERLPDEVLADFHAHALPLGTAASLDDQDVAVTAVRTDPADVAARLDELEWLADDLAGLDDIVLLELDAPVDSGGWAPVVEHGDVTVVTPDGRPHGPLASHGSVTYEVTESAGPAADGLLRGVVVVAIPMAPASAEGGVVVVMSPGWTDVATWSVPQG